MKKFADILKLTDKDMRKELMKTEKELMKLRFESRAGQLTATHKIREARRTIAQLNTALTTQTKNKPLADPKLNARTN